jgi:hypothetical protein
MAVGLSGAAMAVICSIKNTSYTAKNVIGNRLSRLKSASLLIKNIISSLGFIFATHSVLFYIIHV